MAPMSKYVKRSARKIFSCLATRWKKSRISRPRAMLPYYHYQTNEHLREVIDLINSGFFSHGDRDLFRPLIESLLYSDEYLLLADYQSYIEKQDEIGLLFQDQKALDQNEYLKYGADGKILFGPGHPGIL